VPNTVLKNRHQFHYVWRIEYIIGDSIWGIKKDKVITAFIPLIWIWDPIGNEMQNNFNPRLSVYLVGTSCFIGEFPIPYAAFHLKLWKPPAAAVIEFIACLRSLHLLISEIELIDLST
jgi:hypothetical protein